MSELQKATIRYSGVEQKQMPFGVKYKIKDENGKGYSFFDGKKDGSQTKAYQQFLDLKIGDTVEVNYNEEDGVYNGKSVTYRTVMFFSRPNGNTYSKPPQQSVGKDSDDRIGMILENTKLILEMLYKVKEIPTVQVEEEIPAPVEEDDYGNMPF